MERSSHEFFHGWKRGRISPKMILEPFNFAKPYERALLVAEGYLPVIIPEPLFYAEQKLMSETEYRQKDINKYF